MLRKIIAFGVTAGLAKTAWDRYHRKGQAPLPVDITDVIARPVALDRRSPRRVGARRRTEGPSS